MVVQEKVFTLEDFKRFVALDENSDRLFELINGEIIEVSPGRTSNSQVGHLIAVPVYNFCEARDLRCYTSGGDGAYQIGTNVVAPDFAYKPIPNSDDYPDPIAPVWAVEVVSPNDRPDDIANKRAIYVKAKILYWEIYPRQKTVHVYEPGKPLRVLGIDETLDGGNVLPEFTLPVRSIFKD